MEQQSSSLQHIHRLHILRGLAAGLVVIYHAKFVLWSGGTEYIRQFPRATWSVAQYGQLALDLLSSCGKQCVLLFFILSAFVIRHSVRRGLALPTFYRNRILRIYPPFLFSLALASAVLYVAVVYIHPALLTDGLREYNTRLLVAWHNMTWTNAGLALLFLNRGEYIGANFPYWSLLHEGIFYLLFPLYLRTTPLVKGGLLLGCVALTFWTGSFVAYHQIYFLFGLLLYDLFAHGYSLPFRWPNWGYGVAFAGLFVCINLFTKLPDERVADVVMVGFTFLAFEFLLRRPVEIPRPLLWLGDISYSLYLTHMPGLLLAYAVLSRLTGTLIFYERWPYYLATVVAFGFGAATYYTIERPAIRLLQRVKAPKQPVALAQ